MNRIILAAMFLTIMAIAAAVIILEMATAAEAQTLNNPCSQPWPSQAATPEQVRAALGFIPCGLEGTRPLVTTEERLVAKELEAKELELDVRIRAAEAAIRTNNWKYYVSIWK